MTEQALCELDGWIMGQIGHAAYPRGDATWVMPPVHKKFDLFAAVRPSLSHAGIPSIHTGVDILFLRELRACSIRSGQRCDFSAHPFTPWESPE